MRKLCFITLILLPFAVFSQKSEKSYFAKGQKTEAYFYDLDLKPFTGKEAKIFLRQLPAGALSKELIADADNNKGYDGMLRVSYPDNLMVDLYVKTFRYANPFGLSKRKNLNKFERETLAVIRIHNGLACINGCD